MMHNWQTDPRPYDACLKAWREQHGWTWQQTADELCEPLDTVQLHAKGRYPKDTAQRRRLMTLIDGSIPPRADTSRRPSRGDPSP